jgi:predicted transcriptional regulator
MLLGWTPPEFPQRPLPAMLMWLGYINIGLAVFNMIPGFPLDGGRVLRSALWAITHNLRKATRWASWVGQAVAWVLIVLGITMLFGATIPFFGSGLISGLWLAFIGWFLNSAAVQTYQRVVIQDILQDVPVARMMRVNPPTVGADVSVRTLVEDTIMRSDDQGFPVVENNQLVGMVTLDDIRRVPREAWDTTRVREIMTPLAKLAVVSANEDAADAWTKLAQLDVRQLPVVRGTELAGLLRRRDLIRWLQVHSESSAG